MTDSTPVNPDPEFYAMSEHGYIIKPKQCKNRKCLCIYTPEYIDQIYCGKCKKIRKQNKNHILHTGKTDNLVSIDSSIESLKSRYYRSLKSGNDSSVLKNKIHELRALRQTMKRKSAATIVIPDKIETIEKLTKTITGLRNKLAYMRRVGADLSQVKIKIDQLRVLKSKMKKEIKKNEMQGNLSL